MIRRRPALVLFAALTVRAAGLPGPSDPARLMDWRWLARTPDGSVFRIDTFKREAPLPAVEDGYVLADVPGPGVLHHLMLFGEARVRIELDGKVVYAGVPAREWVGQHWRPGQPVGDAPWLYPLASQAWSLTHCAVPLPFGERLRLICDKPDQPAWLYGLQLAGPPELRFGGDRWLAGVREAAAWLRGTGEEVQWGNYRDVPPLPGGRVTWHEAWCPPRGRATLFEADGPGEIAGLRFHLRPPAPDLRRYLLIEMTVDGADAPMLSMPLMDFLGVSHAWVQGWAWSLGDRAAGWRMPTWHAFYERGWFHFPIPYADGLRIDLVNRSDDRPQHVEVRIQSMPLRESEARGMPRLCGTAGRTDLPVPEGSVELFTLPGDGRLVAFSCFSTGHRTLWSGDHRWRTAHRFSLEAADGAVRLEGIPMLPFALPWENSAKTFGLTWSMPSWHRRGWMGGTRHFWLDPPAVHAGDRIRYTAGGPNGPERAETAILWYQKAPYGAPSQPDDVEPLPEVVVPFDAMVEPGGWGMEAEDLLATARPTAGTLDIGTAGARDVRASRGAYLVWDAPGPGAALDVLVEPPPTEYVEVWMRPIESPSGATFGVRLVPANRRAVTPLWARGDPDFLNRVLGNVTFPFGIDTFREWHFLFDARHLRRGYIRNPSPGRPCRLRFVCGTGRGRAFRLALDQLGMNPAPAAPAGWHQAEDLRSPDTTVGMQVEPMAYGRGDFQGWGGLRVSAQREGEAAWWLLVLDGPSAAQCLELRGLVRSGRWTACVGSARAIELTGSDADKPEPAVWQIPLPANADRPFGGSLTIHADEAGEFLFDAWTLRAPAPANQATISP